MLFIVDTASTGYLPEADSADSMMASAPSKTAMETSDTSARVGTGAVIIDSSIWVATTTGLPARRGGADDLLLHAGHRLERHFDAEVAARHHEGVGELDDFVEPLHRLRLLDLGHDAGAAAGELAHFDHVFGALHEGQRDPVDVGLDDGVEIGAILLGQRAHRKLGVGQADALLVGELAAGDDDRLDRPCRRSCTALSSSLPSSISSRSPA